MTTELQTGGKYFGRLVSRLEKIQQRIDAEHKRRWPDAWRLARLKKMRLSFKDRLYRLMRRDGGHQGWRSREV